MICAVCMRLPGHQREIAITVLDGVAYCRYHLDAYVDQPDGPGSPPRLSSWPDPQDFIIELRETLGMFAGALPYPPKQAWEEAIERVREVVAAADS